MTERAASSGPEGAREAEPADGAESRQPAQNEPARKPSRRRGKKNKLLEESKTKLGRWSFFSAHSPSDPVKFVVEGRRIGSTAGDGEAIGAAMVRISRLLRSLGADSMVDDLAFGNSATIQFRARDAEIKRAETELAAARELAGPLAGLLDDLPEEQARKLGDELPEELHEEVEPIAPEALEIEVSEKTEVFEEAEVLIQEVRAALHRAVTDVQNATALASDLLAVRSAAAPETAVAFGSDVAEAYRTLANAVAHAELTITVENPDTDEPVRLTATKAARVADELRAATQPSEFTVTAFGTLSLADQEQNGFGLRLDPDVAKPQALKGKRVVRGTYLPKVEGEIRDKGLWGKEVRATILVVRDALISTSKIRPPSYTLVEVEPRSVP